MGQELTVQMQHSVLTLMDYKGRYWMTNTRIVKYQGMLCENLHIHLEVVQLTTKGLKNHLEVADTLSSPELWEGRMDELDSETAIKQTARRLTYIELLPVVGLRIRCSPTKQTGFSPYEILYGCPLLSLRI